MTGRHPHTGQPVDGDRWCDPCEWCGVERWYNPDGTAANSYMHAADCPTNSTDLLIRRMLNRIHQADKRIAELQLRQLFTDAGIQQEGDP